jgi:hypothetical protein
MAGDGQMLCVGGIQRLQLFRNGLYNCRTISVLKIVLMQGGRVLAGLPAVLLM